jgi:hypothetical protein
MRKILFAKNALAVTLAFAMLSTACSTAWVATLDSVVAAATPALINILQIVAVANGQPLNSGLAAKISTDATAIKTLAAAFAKVSPGPMPGVCRQLQIAVSVYEADQQLVLETAQVSDPNTQAKIALLANLVAGTVNAITAVIPSCQSEALSRSMNAPSAYSVTTFAARYNSVLVEKTGNTSVDAVTAKLQLRQHSKLVQMMTFGKIH